MLIQTQVNGRTTPRELPFALDFPDLRPGTMIDSRHGLRIELPGALPDITARGLSWVVESTPSRLVIRDDLRIGPLRVDVRATMDVIDGTRLRYAITRSVAGMRMAPNIVEYDIIDSRRGALLLRTTGRPDERPSSIRTDGCRFIVDKIGIGGTYLQSVSPLYQPGAPGYVPPR